MKYYWNLTLITHSSLILELSPPSGVTLSQFLSIIPKLSLLRLTLHFRLLSSSSLFLIALLIPPLCFPFLVPFLHFSFRFLIYVLYYNFRNHYHHHLNFVFSLLSWREPSHLLNHLVKFVSSDNLHWVSPYPVKSKFIIQVNTSKMCNSKINFTESLW